MLEIKHLTKIYKTKGGNDTKALDDVSISFGETGLVFLLGKSGSGKSTLLNVAGGLDEPTEGEVVVMGKSSRDFTGSDFDSYRNTFVGFIFQEYNVLNEFNVEDNIALALELQGKKKDKEKIREILAEVELEAYAKRKPNTLSGGQKQRIAIARALVKDPQIIMADEPTGALDSATGKQVFDTLKLLSANRLVIVVSHDREFAEIYGDRIVELKDGKIISDVTKTHSKAEEIGGNIVRNGDILTVRKGAKLGKDELSAIESFLRESDGDVIITKGESDVRAFRRAVRLDEAGARESFSPTAEQPAPYTGEQAKFIRSRLPIGKAIKIGSSGLKLKPFRLVLTLLLSVVAFVMFGLSSTLMLYDGDAVLTESFASSDYKYLTVEKSYEQRVTSTSNYSGDGEYTWEYTNTNPARFTPAEVSSFPNGAFGVYSLRDRASNLQNSGAYYNGNTSWVTGRFPGIGFTAGKAPAADDEIAVSSYFADCAVNGTFYKVEKEGEGGRMTNEKVLISNPSDLVGQYILIGGYPLLISGVFDSGEIPARYDDLKDPENNNVNYMLTSEYSMYIQESLHAAIVANDDFVKNYPTLVASYDMGSDNNFDYCENLTLFIDGGADESGKHRAYAANTYSIRTYTAGDPAMLDVFFFHGQTSLGEKELAIPTSFYSELINSQQPDYSVPDNPEIPAWEKFTAALYTYNAGVVEEYDEELGFVSHPATEEETEAAKKVIAEYAAEHPLTVDFYHGGYYDYENQIVQDGGVYAGEYKIVGLFSGDYEAGVYCSPELYNEVDIYEKMTIETNYVAEADATYSAVFVPYDGSADAIRTLLARMGSEHKNEQTDVIYELDNMLYSNVEMINSLIDDLSRIFLIVGIVLALFSALLLFNFISMSISNKKKEIGILRAVGARGTDVFKIFFAESGIIVGICLLISLVGSAVVSHILNRTLKAEAGLQASLFVFGPLPILLMVGIALVVALVSTFLPVYLAARKKPVESIRAL